MKKFLKVFCGSLAAVLLIFLIYCGIISANIPDTVYLYGGKSDLNFNIPFPATLSGGDEEAVIKLNGNTLKDATYYDFDETLTIETDADSNLKLNAFGILPFKHINIKVEDEKEQKYVLLGGDSIGVTLHTKGALIVGIANLTNINGVSVSPAKNSGLKPGDIILAVNGQEIENAKHLTSILNEIKSNNIILTVKRNDKISDISITPAQDEYDDTFRLGAWVRDSTAGVGTLTYIDPQNNSFAGLGHAIMDVDTGCKLSVKDGDIISSEIIDIIKGEEGAPGELRGKFNYSDKSIGTITNNSEFGIFGYLNNENIDLSEYIMYPVGYQEEVKEGTAKIISTIDDKGPSEFDCYIYNVTPQTHQNQKSFVVKITDPDLLSKTGGIIQGMSGSPIIQNDKLIGAVTHVFVDDPTKGYGIYLEWMMEESEKI